MTPRQFLADRTASATGMMLSVCLSVRLSVYDAVRCG